VESSVDAINDVGQNPDGDEAENFDKRPDGERLTRETL